MYDTESAHLAQQDDWKTQDGRMTKKCRARLCIPALAQHFFVILPFRVFQPPCCVRSQLSKVARLIEIVHLVA